MGQKLTMPRIRNQKKQVMKMDLIIIILQMLVMDRITGIQAIKNQERR